MSSSSQASQSSGRSFPAKKVCRHCKEADVLTSMTFDNPCRRFYRCPNRKHWDDCKFFEWIDPALPEFQKTYFLRLKSENQCLEKQLRQKIALEKMYNERAMENDEFLDEHSEFERRLNDLVDEVQKNKEVVLVLANKLERKLNVVMCFLFVVVLFVLLSLLGIHGHVEGPKMLI